MNYFAPEGSKVGAKTRVYTLSDKKLEFADATSESQELTSEEQSSILMKTQSFCESFKEQQFSDVYTLKNSVSNILESKSSQSRQSQLDGMVTEGMEGCRSTRRLQTESSCILPTDMKIPRSAM